MLVVMRGAGVRPEAPNYDPPNFLVLDEPTNHLDLAIKDMLTAALADSTGR